MTDVRALFVMATVGAFALALACPARVTAADAGASAGPCVAVRPEVRYGAAAYNHIVVLMNVCERAQACTVTTDVNPEPIRASVPPRATTEVVTFLGSPARVFVPRVTCLPER